MLHSCMSKTSDVVLAFFYNFDILLARKCKAHCIEIVKKIIRKTSVISDLKAVFNYQIQLLLS